MTDEEMAEEYVKKEGFRSGMFGELDNITSSEANKEIEQAFLAGLKAGRPQWHDLRECSNDLPKESVIEGLSERVIGITEIAKNQYMSQECRYDFVDKIWKTHKDPYVTDVIAWCEIPKFDKE